ncbi:MAG: hypothetical protein IV090_10830 [Candidatus Sericytochromatia bacterium]|nr:hypothetical protein [Candidatus Sericytochromatia bacterium]
MKNTLFGLRILLVAGAVMLMGATSVLSAPQQALKPAGSEMVKPVQNKALDFTLTNATGYEITGLYLSPTGTDSWGESILPGAFNDGDTLNISFSPDAEAAEWDMRADWTKGEGYVYWMGLPLDQINALTLKYDEATDKTTAIAE